MKLKYKLGDLFIFTDHLGTKSLGEIIYTAEHENMTDYGETKRYYTLKWPDEGNSSESDYNLTYQMDYVGNSKDKNIRKMFKILYGK